MADFMSAVRQSVQRQSDINRRKSRLSGRPQTQAEVAAPYEALATTAGQRLAAQKQMQQQDRGLDIEEGLGERRLDIAAEQNQTQADLERQRLAEMRRQAEESMALQRKQMRAQMDAAAQAREAAEKQQTMQLATVGAGLAVGAISEWGSDIAKGVGSMFSKVTGGCLVVSACEGRESYEVDVTRAFRDTLMDAYSLTGYYVLAPFVSALEERFEWFRRVVKGCLVNHLIDYGEWVLGVKPHRERRGSKTISRAFLWTIRALGKRIGV